MNAITPRSRPSARSGLIDDMPVFPMSQALHWACGSIGATFKQPTPPPVLAEAAALLDTMRPYVEPVPEATVREWFAPIAASVKFPKAAADVPAWFEALMLAIGHMPAAAFSRQTQRDALLKLETWPSVAEVAKFVIADARQISATVRELTAILTPTASRISRSPEDEALDALWSAAAASKPIKRIETHTDDDGNETEEAW
jgi:hypothetical protein